MSRYDEDPRGVVQLSPRRWRDSRPVAIALLAVTAAASVLVAYAAIRLAWWYFITILVGAR
jgi:hypothetical protein